MEKKNTGFFTTLKKEVIRGLSPSRSRPKRTTAKTTLPPPHPLRQNTTSTTNIPSILIRARHRNTVSNHHDDPPTVASACTSTDPDGLGGRYSGGVLRNAVEVLAPLMEGPMGEDAEENRARIERKEGWGRWMKGQLSRGTSSSSEIFNAVGLENAAHKRSDLRLLLGVMGAPLSPVGVFSLPDLLPRLCIKDTPIECSFAQYILQQYLAATGGQKLQKSFKNAYAMGKVKMVVSGYETANKAINNCTTSSSRVAESGGFVLWQMNPDMWYIELSVGGNKVHAGCNGKLVWRHTPWLGAHAAKGPVRPLRRALQGLDPRTTAGMFGNSRCIGEKKVNGVECFVLKLTSDPQNLKARSEGPAEIIRHVMFGYFSQRTGVLVQLEDSHLTRIQANNCGDAVYWETTINSFLDDYRPVEGMMIAHSGRSVVTLFKFGEMAMSHSKTRMEESWCIEEVAYNVAGLSVDCFIPPADIIRSKSISSTLTGLTAPTPPSDLDGFQKKHAPPQPPHSNRSRVAAITHQNHGNTVDNVVWRVEISYVLWLFCNMDNPRDL